MGYGVIGSPTVSGSVSLGSSPGTPAHDRRERIVGQLHLTRAPSSSGLGRRPLTAVARVRIPSGLRLSPCEIWVLGPEVVRRSRFRVDVRGGSAQQLWRIAAEELQREGDLVADALSLRLRSCPE